MKKPDLFLQEVWDKLNDTEKKELYLNDLLISDKAPHYLEGFIESLTFSLDKKIEIAEKFIYDLPLAPEEKKELDAADWD